MFKKFFIFLLFLPISCNANDFLDVLKINLNNCFDLDEKLKNCSLFSCVKPYPEIRNAWYTIIVKGNNSNNKCYTISYAFLGEKVVSEIEHCWYDHKNLSSAISAISAYKNSENALKAKKAEDDWSIIRQKSCKMVISNN